MLSKTERILAIINYYLPHESLYQYHYEADSIAYNTRKNSSLKTVEKLVRDTCLMWMKICIINWLWRLKRVCETGTRPTSIVSICDQIQISRVKRALHHG